MTEPGAVDRSWVGVADVLWEAAATGSACEPVRDRLSGVEAAYRVQLHNIERAQRAGRRIVGRKIGLTSAAVRRQLGVDQPDFGTLLDDMCYADTEEIPMRRLLQARVEAEVAVVLGRDLDQPNPTVAEVLRAVEFVVASIEVVDSRIRQWDIRIEDTVADNASSGVFVLGLTPRRLLDLDLRLAGMRMTCDGDEVSTGAGAASLGHPITAVAWLAKELSAMGTPLRAGEVVLSGALGPVVPVRAGAVYEAEISGLGSVRAVFGADG